MNQRVYVETTILSYRAARPSSQTGFQHQHSVLREFQTELHKASLALPESRPLSWRVRHQAAAGNQ